MSDENEVKTGENGTKTVWTVELDPEKCTICEACVWNCPPKALTLERKDGIESIYFEQTKCIGCQGDRACHIICPEDAIVLLKATPEQETDEVVTLIQGEMVQCAYCHEYFSPERKLAQLEQKGLGHGVNRMHCPLCRRTNLVVALIDTRVAPEEETKAKYRQAKDILRRARFRLFKEEAGEPVDDDD